MLLYELMRVLPTNPRIDIRVVKDDNDINISNGLTCEVKEIVPVERYKLKITVK